MGSAVRVEAEIAWSIIPEFTAAMNGKADVVRARALEQIAEQARARVRVDTGETRDSITVTKDTVDAGGAALFLEYGTVRQAAYPFLGPAAESVQTSFASEFAGMFAISNL